jgi:hypothetical protein
VFSNHQRRYVHAKSELHSSESGEGRSC